MGFVVVFHFMDKIATLLIEALNIYKLSSKPKSQLCVSKCEKVNFKISKLLLFFLNS